MKQKVLILLFADDNCRQNHALMYANDLFEAGHEVQVILEGAATRCLRRLDDKESLFYELFMQAQERGILKGSCFKASSGCANIENEKTISDLAKTHDVPLLDGMKGHASINEFVDDGFQVITL